MKDVATQSFWTLLNQLLLDRPFEKRSLESILGAPLRRVDKNEFFEFYECNNIAVRGVLIEKIELRAKKEEKGVGLIVIDLKEPCITRSELKGRFEQLSISPPSGHSPSELTYYTFDDRQLRVSFGFGQERSDCVVRLAIDALSPT